MRPGALVSMLAVVLALAAAGCGSSSSSEGPTTTFNAPPTPPPPPATPQPPPPPTKPSRIYKKKELARLVLQPKDAPADLVFVRGESGRKTLEQIGFILPQQVNEAKAYGFRAVQDAIFQAKSKTSDRRVSERVWLLKNAKGASGWLEKSKADAVGLGFSDLKNIGIGDESWSITGQVQDGVIITHAFRLGNVVVLVSSYAAQEALSPSAARAAAVAAFARARKA
jgi:hypothetical protein